MVEELENLEDIYKLLNVGCDKFLINSSVILNPDLINESAKDLGVNVLLLQLMFKKRLMVLSCFVKGGEKILTWCNTKWAKSLW